MRLKFLLALLASAALAGFWAVTGVSKPPAADIPAAIPSVPAGDEVITLGAGCFWHMGAVFQQIPGVVSVTAGYMSDAGKNSSFTLETCGDTGHSEVTRIVFNPTRISLAKLLDVFWVAHRPTAPYARGARAVIFYVSEAQRQTVEQSKREAAEKFSQPILTEIAPAGTFYSAPESDQNYYEKGGNTSCGLFAMPNLKELGLK